MGLPVPETVFCDVYINDELFGVYLAVQPVDETLLSAWFEDGTGDLYKPEGINTYTGMIEKTNVDKDGEEALVNMLNVLNNGGDLAEVLNVDMILRYLAVDTAIINLDSYVGGMFHNYFLYGEDGEYMIIPWDLNETFMPFGSSGHHLKHGNRCIGIYGFYPFFHDRNLAFTHRLIKRMYLPVYICDMN